MSEGPQRTTISGIMVVTALVGVLLASLRYLDEPWFWLALIAFPFALPWVVAPVRLRRNVWQPIDLGHRPFDLVLPHHGRGRRQL